MSGTQHRTMCVGGVHVLYKYGHHDVTYLAGLGAHLLHVQTCCCEPNKGRGITKRNPKLLSSLYFVKYSSDRKRI